MCSALQIYDRYLPLSVNTSLESACEIVAPVTVVTIC